MTMDVSFVATSASMGNPDTKAVVAETSQELGTQTEQEAILAKDAQVQEKQANGLDSEALTSVTDELNDMMSLMRKGLAFKVDEESGQSIISVLDVDTGNVIRQIPNEEALELAQKLAEVAGSLLKTEA